MSSRERVLTLKLDDKNVRDAIKKIEEAGFGTKSSGGGGTKKSTSGDIVSQIFGKNSVMFKNLAQLTLIGGAILALVKLVQKISSSIIDSSPILQVMLKLFQTAITFILRPIGDFIGLFLRPFLIMFLRASLDFYKTVGPIFRNIGGELGKKFAANFESPEKLLANLILGMGGGNIVQQGLATLFEQIKIPEFKLPVFDNLSFQFEVLSRKLSNFASTLPDRIRAIAPIIVGAFGELGKFVGDIALRATETVSLILPMITGITDLFTGIFNSINESFNANVVPKLAEFSEFITALIDQARAPVQAAIEAIAGFFRDLAAFFTNLIESINGLIFSIPGAIAGLVGGGNGGGNVTNNFFEGAIQAGQEVVDQIFNFGNQVGKSINDTISGSSR